MWLCVHFGYFRYVDRALSFVVEKRAGPYVGVTAGLGVRFVYATVVQTFYDEDGTQWYCLGLLSGVEL